MTDQSTWYAEWRQNRRLREKLSMPEGQMQEDLEHTLPQSEVRRVMHEAWQSGTYPRGRIDLPWEVWKDDVIDMCAMNSYPQAMPDDLFILSADGGKLALWRATK